MNKGFIDSIPSELVTHVRAGCGIKGERWLSDLPDLIADLENRWSLTVEDPFPGIEYNYVASALRSDGEHVVVKVAPPWEPVEIFGEAAYLREHNGRGCVRLIAEEQALRAIQIERMYPGESLFSHFAGREADSVLPAIAALKEVLMPVPSGIEHIVELDEWFAGLRRYPGTVFPTVYAAKALEYTTVYPTSRAEDFICTAITIREMLLLAENRISGSSIRRALLGMSASRSRRFSIIFIGGRKSGPTSARS